jgi:hypothetical protein
LVVSFQWPFFRVCVEFLLVLSVMSVCVHIVWLRLLTLVNSACWVTQGLSIGLEVFNKED